MTQCGDQSCGKGAIVADPSALELRDIQRGFFQGAQRLEVLRGVSLSIAAGETVALIGPSGSGKSTLLQIAGLLEQPDGGEVLLAGQACGPLDDDSRSQLRRTRLGFVFQFHHLLPEFSALENVTLPQLIAGIGRGEARQRAGALLKMVGLAEREGHRPAELSGGEQQRVAIARAVANGPRVLLADEPTGNLDHHTADEVFGQLINLVHRTELGALVATHNPDLAARMDRVVRLEDGLLVSA
jgi:lipoprotein-releasing system ATP-binding protein